DATPVPFAPLTQQQAFGLDFDLAALRGFAYFSARFVSLTSRAICAESSAALAKASSSRSRFTNATSTSSPYTSPEKSRRKASSTRSPPPNVGRTPSDAAALKRPSPISAHIA